MVANASAAVVARVAISTGVVITSRIGGFARVAFAEREPAQNITLVP
jgi:alkylhydroperoxidase family enzyme